MRARDRRKETNVIGAIRSRAAADSLGASRERVDEALDAIVRLI